MNKEYTDVVVGINDNNEVVFIGDVGIEDTRGLDYQFSVVFQGYNMECPKDEDEVIEDYVKDWIECNDKDVNYDRCVEFDCKPSELYQYLMDDISISHIYDAHDRLYEKLKYKDEWGDIYDIYLAFSFSTPMDYDGKIVKFINDDMEKLFNKINKIGKQYHLKQIPLYVWNDLEKDLERYLSDEDTRHYNEIKFIENTFKTLNK